MSDFLLKSALDALEQAGTWLADAQRDVAELAIRRQEHEAALIASLIGNPNPMTNKPHSATSAKDAADADESIMDMRRERVVLERNEVLARTAYEIAKVRAWHLVNTTRSEVTA